MDEEVHNLVCERIIEAIGRDSNVDHLINFLARLKRNPSQKSQRELYQFLEVNDLPIRPDGKFIAYKRIRDDYTDTYTGTVDNRPGSTIPRKRWDQVDDDSNRTCSNGYHVCGFGYLSHFWGERLISVLVDPADVVSVPVDYNDTKMRVTYYTPHEELNIDLVRNEDDVLRNNRAEWEGWTPTPDEGDEDDDEQQFWDGYQAAKRDILDLISEEV
jgi:hypothetical protein